MLSESDLNIVKIANGYLDNRLYALLFSDLEKKGYVVKETNGANLYRAKICLTEEGRRAAEYVQNRANLAVSLAGEGVSERDREIFYSTFESIAEKLEQISEKGLPEDK